MTKFIDISNQVRKYAKNRWALPQHQLLNFLVWAIGPLFGLSCKWMSANLGIDFICDNERSIKELGVKYRPLTETLNDHYNSWASNQGSKKRK